MVEKGFGAIGSFGERPEMIQTNTGKDVGRPLAVIQA